MFDKSKPFNTILGSTPEGYVAAQDGEYFTRAQVDAAFAEPAEEAVVEAVTEQPAATSEATEAVPAAPVADPVVVPVIDSLETPVPVAEEKAE